MIFLPSELMGSKAFLEAGIFAEADTWSTHNENHEISKFKNSSISDADYHKLKGYIDTMHNAETYAEYYKGFKAFCYYCHILPKGVIIRKHELTKGEEHDRNGLYVEYTYNTKKIKLPENTVLYHMSKVGGIKELIPAFRGKSVKGYLYDKPRIYFTIRRHMPKFLADYKMNEKMHIYIAKKDIRDVYVDPLVWNKLQGAVYVETNTPIPVDELTEGMAKELLTKISDKAIQVIGNPDAPVPDIDKIVDKEFEDLFEFVTTNGLILME